MPSHRIIPGIGLTILLVISAASIGLDAESRSDAALVDHTLAVLKRISDIRLLIRGAESTARGFVFMNDPNLANEFRDSHDRIAPAFADLVEATKDNPAQTQLLEATEPFIARRLAGNSELVRLQTAGDSAGITALTARAEGREVIETVEANLDKLAAREEELLAVRSAASQLAGRFLLSIDLAGVALILILAAILIRGSRRANRKLETSLSVTKAANESLEAAVAERTAHLVAAHEEIRRSASVLQSTFDSMAEAVLVVDTKGAVVLSNAAAQRLLHHHPGMTVEQMREQSSVYQADGSSLPADDLPVTRALRGEQFEGSQIIVRLAGSRDPVHLVVSGGPLRDGSGAISGAALVYHDITASHETERKLHQAQKLDAIGKLTGGVAHDFNNMLTVITGTTETLVAGLQNRPDLLKTAALIDQAAERCTELIQHLLAFARKQPLQPRNVDINGVVVDIAKLLRPTLGEQIEIDAVLETEVTASYIDPSQLANSLLNMAINARDAMPNGGKLLLETRNVVLDEAYARANADVRPGPYVMLAVSDTGTGMPADVRDKVFEPFFTTKEVGKGSGLGLSMVYGFVKQSGGHIKIYSEEGHGTTIRLYLPPATGHAEAPVRKLTPLSSGTETILVVEDDSLVRSFVTAQLHSLGYKTVAAANSGAALAHVASGKPFDLLFTDIVMPGGVTGPQLADQVAKLRPGTRVLYTSGYTENSIVHHGRLDQGVLLLSKPYRKSALASMVRLALGDAAV
jgi:PAS domain S-box-containing protein